MKQAAEELLKRRKARNHLIDFTQYTFVGGYEVADHHRLIAQKLEDVAEGKIKKLMIFMPPRHGKTELASRRFPAWFLGKYPDKSIIATSYNADLANDIGRDVRNLVNAPEYQMLFPVRLSSDSRAANRWHTEKRGSYFSVGIGGGITGRGADIALIDDPVKGWEDANSKTQRDRAYNWFQSELTTRLMPNAGMILIQTRWHEDDLAGRILQSQNDWEVLSLPALNENDEALWPEWYSAEDLMKIRDEKPPLHWNALYHQNPMPDSGTFFERDWFEFYDNAPEGMHYYMASDYAVTQGDGDYTEHGVIGIDHDNNIYLVDWWSGQTTADVWIDSALKLIKTYRPFKWVGEAGPIRRAVEPFIAKRMHEESTYCHLEWIARTKDKATMARSFQGRASMGKVFLPQTQWAYDLLQQLLSFPAGKHDDKVDVCALFGLVLDELPKGALPKKPEDKNAVVDRWSRLFKLKKHKEDWMTA